MNTDAVYYPALCYGEILWDVLPGVMVPGGAPMNVAYHLARNGVAPALVTRVGPDEDGKKLIELMERQRLSTQFFQMDFELPTGKVYATVLDNHDVAYDIRKPAAWDNIQWEEDFNALLSDASYLVFGCLACRTATSRDTLFRLREAARYRVLDINLRPPHFSRHIVDQLLEDVDLLKLNLAELELITGWFSNHKDTQDRVQLLQDRFRIPNIVVTRGDRGAMMNLQGALYDHPGFQVQVVDCIGSGDAFLAGFIAGMYREANPADALDFACALGALVAGSAGPCPEYEVSDVQQLIAAG